MKAGKILLAAAFALTLAASANAGIHVWWAMADGSDGAMGQTLNLECTAGARCDWDLKMMASWDAGDTIVGWSEDLLIAPELFDKITVKSTSAGSSLFGGAGSPGYGNHYYYGYNLLYGAFGQSGTGPVAGPQNVALVYITLSAAATTPAGLVEIQSEGGGNFWAATPMAVDFFGHTDDLSPTSYGDVRTNNAITINVVPEPSTVAFLGLGALALIRRRR